MAAADKGLLGSNMAATKGFVSFSFSLRAFRSLNPHFQWRNDND